VSGAPEGASSQSRRLAAAESLEARVVEAGASVVVDDWRQEESASGSPTDRFENGPVVVVPLAAAGVVMGALTLVWAPEQESAYGDVDLRSVERYAGQAALALQVARSREDAEKLAVFEDRDRIGRDLHDLVIQRLFAVGLSLENSARMSNEPEIRERVGRAVDDIDATIKEIRRSIFALSVAEQSSDLRAEVSDLVARAAKVLGFKPSVSFDGPIHNGVPQQVAPHVLAVLGEALTNIAKHAAATAAQVSLHAGTEIVVTVSDDGRGISGATTESGLRNMRDRAESLRGRCTVISVPDGGTTVTWLVPRD
jgi:signal transduction histidine kinase